MQVKWLTLAANYVINDVIKYVTITGQFFPGNQTSCLNHYGSLSRNSQTPVLKPDFSLTNKKFTRALI